MQNTHFSALVTYIVTVNPSGVDEFLASHNIQLNESVSVEAKKQYVNEVIVNYPDSMDKFISLHPEKDDFVVATSDLSFASIKTEKYWNEKRIKVGVIVSLMLALVIMLAIKFE